MGWIRPARTTAWVARASPSSNVCEGSSRVSAASLRSRHPGAPAGLITALLPSTATEALTPAAVGPIYRARYWNPSHACDCPPGVDLMVFDEAVNQGVGRAVASLQAALGVTVDGAFGPATRTALSAADPARLIRAIAANRETHYRALPTFPRFGHGWLARLARTTELALADVQVTAAPSGSAPPDRTP